MSDEVNRDLTLQDDGAPAESSSPGAPSCVRNALAATLRYAVKDDTLDFAHDCADIIVGVRSACNGLGVSASRQLEKLRDDASTTVRVLLMVPADGEDRSMAFARGRSL